MSEPVSNVEIEDVLSSIRRLVSEEKRPAPRPNPEDVPKRTSRLVLTPSLLVVDSAKARPGVGSLQAAEPEGDVADAAPEIDRSEAEAATESQEHRSDPESEDIAAGNDPRPQTEPEAGPEPGRPENSNLEVGADSRAPSRAPMDLSDFDQDDELVWVASETPWSDPEATLYEAAETADVDENPQDENPQDENPQDENPQDEDAVDAAEDALQADAENREEPPEASAATPEEMPADEARVAELSGLQDAALGLPETSPETSHEQSQDDAAQEEILADSTGLAEDAQRAPPVSDLPDGDPDEGAPANTATLSAKIAALEAKIGQTQDQWEPDGELGDDYAGTRVETIEWQDHDEQDRAAPRRASMPADAAREVAGDTAEDGVDQAARDDSDDSLDIMADDDAILDEDSLRELVADIVRQELQGALGERITRNVRKLVRREIHRALTAQELD